MARERAREICTLCEKHRETVHIETGDYYCLSCLLDMVDVLVPRPVFSVAELVRLFVTGGTLLPAEESKQT